MEFRSIDGSGNNLTDPGINMAGTDFTRIGQAHYADGISVPLGGPNPRTISNLVVGEGDVARPQPPVLGEHPLGLLRIVEVAEEDVGALHPDLAGVTDEHVVAGVIDEADLHALHGPADRPGSHRPGAAGALGRPSGLRSDGRRLRRAAGRRLTSQRP